MPSFSFGLSVSDMMSKNIKDSLCDRKESFSPFIKRLKQLYANMDQAYRKAANYYAFTCKGCEDNCCQTRFYHHAVAEYVYLMEGFHALGEKQQSEIKKRALTACKKQHEADEKQIAIHVMCPLNIDGLCVLYEYRPMICRLHGIPHELQKPGQGIICGPGCGLFATQCQGKPYFKFDRTPFYVEMANLEQDLRQYIDISGKFKMTIARMLF